MSIVRDQSHGALERFIGHRALDGDHSECRGQREGPTKPRTYRSTRWDPDPTSNNTGRKPPRRFGWVPGRGRLPASKVRQINLLSTTCRRHWVFAGTSHLLKPFRIERRPGFSIRNFRTPPPSHIGRGARRGRHN